MFRLVLFLFLSFISFPLSAAEKIVLAADSWCPYNCKPGSKQEGAMVEIIKEIMKENDIEVEYISMPWERAIGEARSGRINGIIGALKSDAPDFIFPKYPQGVITQSFFTDSKSNWRYQGIESLRNVSLGAIDSYSYGEEINEYISYNKNDNSKVQLSAGDDALEKNIKKLMAGRLDIIIEDKNVFEFNAKKLDVYNKVRFAGAYVPKNRRDDYLYVGFSPSIKDSKKYAKIVSSEIREMNKSGKLQAILFRYNFEDWSKATKWN